MTSFTNTLTHNFFPAYGSAAESIHSRLSQSLITFLEGIDIETAE